MHPPVRIPSITLRLAAAALLACAAGASPARTSVGVSVNVGVPVYGSVYPALPIGAVSVGWHRGHRYWYRGGVWYRPWGPRWVVAAPPLGVVLPGAVIAAEQPPVVVQPAPPVAMAPPKPDPIIYPRNAQSPEQTELDRQECNRWATTQPQAVADASVFQRAVEACMDGRGYSMR
jgi:hypothetical protein